MFIFCSSLSILLRMVAITADAAGVLAGPSLNGEGWRQAAELGLALVLSAAVGLEREIRQKNAGLRTHTLVGVGAALFMLISKYGFTDVLEPRLVVLDPSRVAAQIVTGVGFLGAGLIFVRRDSVRGLTTAASIWVTAAIGSASGAGLPVLAALATGIYFIVALAFPARRPPPAPLGHRDLGPAGPLPRRPRHPARRARRDHPPRLRHRRHRHPGPRPRPATRRPARLRQPGAPWSRSPCTSTAARRSPTWPPPCPRSAMSAPSWPPTPTPPTSNQRTAGTGDAASRARPGGTRSAGSLPEAVRDCLPAAGNPLVTPGRLVCRSWRRAPMS